MPSIVLNDYLRSTIRFNKAATVEANRLSQLNTTGQIDRKDSNNIPHAMNADRLQSEISELEFEISKADKAFNTIETSMMAIDQMRIMVDKIADLEKAAATETDTALSAAYTDQISELKDQMVSLGESASYQGTNLFSGWGTENMTIGGQNFQLQQVDFNDVVSGFAYRGGNVLGIENGDFDTSAYPNLIAAFGPDSINNVYADFTGNQADGILGPTANLSQSGPNGSFSVEMPNNNSPASGTGSYVQIPQIEIPDALTIGTWARIDRSASTSRIFNVANTTGSSNPFNFNWSSLTNNFRVGYATDTGTIVTTDTTDANDTRGNGTYGSGDWTFIMMTVNDAGDVAIYQDGDKLTLTNDNLTAPPALGSRDSVYLGAAGNSLTTESNLGGLSDFIIFDKALTDDEAQNWYDDIASKGLENSFFSMDSEALTSALDKIEGHLTGAQIGIEATRNQMAIKSELYAEETTNLLSIDTEEVALQTNLAQTRQTLAMTSLSISSQSHSNILNLFN